MRSSNKAAAARDLYQWIMKNCVYTGRVMIPALIFQKRPDYFG